MKSRLTAICGPMFSGKSLELIHRVDLIETQGLDVVCYTPNSRYTQDGGGRTMIRSRHGAKLPAFYLDSGLSGYKLFSALTESIRLGFNPPDVIAIDEAQFFIETELCFAVDEMMRHYGVNFIIAGLSRDYAGLPFGAMPSIITMADEVVQLHAVCSRCKSLDGTRTIRVTDSKEKVVLDSDIYDVYCSTCLWESQKTKSEIESVEQLKKLPVKLV